MRSKKMTLINNCEFLSSYYFFLSEAAVVTDRLGRQKVYNSYPTGSKYNHELGKIDRSCKLSANRRRVDSFVFTDVSEELAAIIIRIAQEDYFYA
jgi:hypothetical protein